jgi:hypothetical protein
VGGMQRTALFDFVLRKQDGEAPAAEMIQERAASIVAKP